MHDQNRNFKLSPSDFAFLWEECGACFYNKVRHGESRPRIPMPKIFIKLDGVMKTGFAGRRTEEVCPDLRGGTVAFGDNWVESNPIHVPGHEATCFVRGRTDSIVRFDDGTFGVIDFKTAERNPKHLGLYARQLHAYALALEDPAPGKIGLGPVSELGILAFEPSTLVEVGGGFAYAGDTSYVEIERNDDAFLGFLSDVLDVLEADEAPAPGPDCAFCRFRKSA